MSKIFKLFLTCCLVYVGTAHSQIKVTDIVGRQVTLKQPAKRVILGEGRSLLTLALLHPKPVDLVVGWTGDFKKSGGNLYEDYRKHFPEMDRIPAIGSTGKETVSVEKILSLKPDLAIFGAGSHGPDAKSADVIQKLNAAGIPIVFIDFRLHPFKNTLPSMEILGKVLGREKQAQEYIKLYKKHMNVISQRLAKQKVKRPKVYMEMVRGDLVGSPGKGNLGEFIEFAGGHNIGSDVLPGEVGTINMEYVIASQPDVYIATGIALPGEKGFVIGQGITPSQARESLKSLTSKPVLRPLNAIKNNRVYGMWHLFYDSPLNIVALEAIARWCHPQLFKDLNPHGTLGAINKQFLTVKLSGAFFLEN
ncbi:iron ABC transporter substrate-binding protein [Pseudoxanthomonas sp. SGD-10]|nr:iron ABC transporter substrate-binding protein [Pseudoxanthomonas sp. SGD-10]